MECHDAKLLLTFAQRKCEDLDAAERAALDRHLGACPDCAAFANAERRADATFSKVMLGVPVPTDLSRKVMQRLADQRPARPWKWLATAAAILIAVAGSGVWFYYSQPTDVEVEHLKQFIDYVEPFVGMKPDDVEKYFDNEGLQVKVPDEFDYDNLRHVEIVKFRNQRVGKLLFRKELNNGVTVQAYTIILPHAQFRVDQLPAGQLNHATTIEIKHSGEFTYVIYHRGNLKYLYRPQNAV